MTYDNWKTTDPRDYEPCCICCGCDLSHCYFSSDESWVCDDCLGVDPEPLDEDDLEERCGDVA